MKLAALLLAIAAPVWPASISGLVQDTYGVEIREASVRIETESGTAGETKVAPDGTFRFADLPGGSYVLTASAPVFMPLRVRVELRDAEDRTLPSLQLSPGANGDCFRTSDDAPESTNFLPAGVSIGALAFSIRARGTPVSGARITLECHPFRCESRTAVTETSGRASFDGLAPGSYSLTVEKNGFWLSSARFEVGPRISSSYRIELTPCPNGDCSVHVTRFVRVVCE